MKLPKTIGWGVTIMVALAMASPPPARAGDKEWARVGKVLTGLAVVGAVAYAVRPPPPVYPSCPPPVYSERVVVVEREPVIVRERIEIGCSPPPRHGGLSRWGRPACDDGLGEIVIQNEPGRRLYQPAVRGHIAFIQQWDPCRREWVTIGSHPSVWR